MDKMVTNALMGIKTETNAETQSIGTTRIDLPSIPEDVKQGQADVDFINMSMQLQEHMNAVLETQGAENPSTDIPGFFLDMIKPNKVPFNGNYVLY